MKKWQRHPSDLWRETVIDENGDTICSVACSYKARSEIAKNVALIAAAPELLVALEGAIVALKIGEYVDRQAAIDYATEVLAKVSRVGGGV